MSGVGKVVPPQNEILKNISLNFFPGAKIGVLGYNGAGKSTLLRIMAGVDTEYSGEARPQTGIKIGYLPQEPELDNDLDVRGNVELGVAETKTLLDQFNEVNMKFAEPMSDDEMNDLLARQAELQEKIEAAGAWDLDRKLDVAADALRLPPWDAAVEHLSGGEKRRVATVVAVTHDRYFLDNVAGWILELDRGHGIPWEGNYSSWLEQKQKRLEHEERSEKARMKSMQAELEWVHANPKGRQSKSKARLKRFEELSSQEYQKRSETRELYIPPGPRLGDIVVEIDGGKKSYGDKLLYQDLEFKLPRGGIVGIIGPNGAGKTTLFRIIVGQDKLDEGSIKIGDTVKIAYVDQSRDDLDGSKTVWQELSDGLDNIVVGSYEVPSRAYVSRFNFRGAAQQKFVKDLSGGERNRLHLAKLLKSGGNLLLLDEPTNDLDVETLRALEEAILDFPGSVVVISHDRWFLDRIATHIIAFEGNSEVYTYEGNYTEYESHRKQRLGQDADQPHRIKYKKLDA
jgi:ATPase subunit of ABC transporter with duplicated ATPase domains